MLPSSGCSARLGGGRRDRSGKALAAARVDAQSLNRAIEEVRKGRKADSASAEEGYDALKKYTRDLTEAAREGKLDPVIGRDEEIRRTSPRRPWPTATCSTSSCKCSTTGG